MESNINNVYVKSIYDLAIEEKKIKKLVDLSNLLVLEIEKQPKIINYLSSYNIDIKEKKDFFSKITNEKIFLNWLLILVIDKKIFNLLNLLKGIIKKYNLDNDILEGIVWTAENLSSVYLNKIKNTFFKKYNKKIYLINKIDKELIGGVKIEIDSDIYDNSIKGQLENLIYKVKFGTSEKI